jgi:uncharacterized membrane protein YfcA
MESVTLIQGFVLCGAAFIAGLIDAVVGGGGLIQIPALFATLPEVPAATLVGTNKVSGVWGTSFAAWRFARSTRIEWAAALPGAIAAFAFAFVGAWAVTVVPPDLLRRALPFLLVVVGAYTVYKKDFGSIHAPVHRDGSGLVLALAVGAAIGFYDGFFGPGTGSFLIFLYVRFFGFDFLAASATAKLVNVACNIAALMWFAWSGHLLVAIGLMMAPFNLCGAFLGSRLAIRHGSAFVRKLFLLVIALLVARTAYDAFLR